MCILVYCILYMYRIYIILYSSAVCCFVTVHGIRTSIFQNVKINSTISMMSSQLASRMTSRQVQLCNGSSLSWAYVDAISVKEPSARAAETPDHEHR